MQRFDNGGILVESVEELPSIDSIDALFGDYETTSGNPKLMPTNPWHNCAVAGFGFTFDGAPNAWYLPCGHRYGPNLPRETVRQYVQDLMRKCKRWFNHNIKYDMHVQKNDFGIDPPEQVVDTLTSAKIVNSDLGFKGGYGLDALSKRWLHYDISHYEAALKPYLGKKNKDYGNIPSDRVGEYGCQDVLTNRHLAKFIKANMPEQCESVWQTERELTYVLYQMERVGIRVDETQLVIQEMRNCNRLIEIDAELSSIVGRSFRPTVNGDCYDVLCNQYGLPVLMRTEEDDEETGEKRGNPSFKAAALEMYALHPFAPHKVVALIQEYRKRDMMNRFVEQYRELNVNGLLHGFYNQAVRTGRMSCSEPNMQQLNDELKRLMLPHDGCAFMSADYSQIEMRTIAHYIKDEALIGRFNNDPTTDMHEWVASLQPGLDRDAGKTLNFSVAFGLGKEKTVLKLAANPKVVAELMATVQGLVAEGKLEKEKAKEFFDALCIERGERIYDTYHALLPGIKATSRAACRAAEARGYVFNLAGRRRHLDYDSCYKAFNTINQSSAADIMKERTVALYKATRGTGIELAASVHDETLCHGPAEVMNDPRTINDIAHVLENPSISLAVPIKIGYGVSKHSWFHAAKGPKKGGEGGKTIETQTYTGFAHLLGSDAELSRYVENL
jgi:DNA polymerase-1